MFVHREKMNLKEFVTSLQADLISGGFKTIFPSVGQPVFTGDEGFFVVESVAAMNPVQEQQAYRIKVELGKTVESKGDGFSFVQVHIASTRHITDSGKTFPYPEVLTAGSGGSVTVGTTPYTMGLLGTTSEPKNRFAGTSGSQPLGSDLWRPGQVFIGRGLAASSGASGASAAVSGNSQAYNDASDGVNYSYTLSIGSHGVVLFAWENTTEDKPVFSMFAVQSPVNKDTGAPLTDLKSPIFCVYSNDNTGYKKFIVNESDVATPTKTVPAGEDTTDSAAILNEEEQVAVKLDNKYLITFPNRVNTERFAYSEELDMIAYTSAKVIGEDTVLELKVYGEDTPRKYRAMKANKANNNGMRLLVLQNGAGVDDTDHVAGGGNPGDGGGESVEP